MFRRHKSSPSRRSFPFFPFFPAAFWFFPFLLLIVVTGIALFPSLNCSSAKSSESLLAASGSCPGLDLRVVETVVPSRLYASDMGPRYRRKFSYRVLSLKIRGGASYSFSLPRSLAGIPPSRLRLRFSRDCRNAAFSQNAGRTYFLLSLNQTRPFLCRHRAFQKSDPYEGDSPGVNLALDLLENHNRHPDPDTIPRRNRFTESRAAFLYVAANARGERPRKALLSFLSGGPPLYPRELTVARKALAARENFKREALALANRGSRNALRLFYGLEDARRQKALGQLLLKELSAPRSHQSCERLVAFTEALLVHTARLQQGGPGIVSAFVRAARPSPCPLKVEPNPYDSEVWSMRGENARIHALKGLAAARTPLALKELKKLAAPPCMKLNRVKQTIRKSSQPGIFFQLELDPNKIANNRYVVTTHRRYSLSCFARKILKIKN